MSIQVNEFRYIPGKNDTEYIKLLKKALERQKQITNKAIAKIKELNYSESPNGWIPCSSGIISDHEVLCCSESGNELIGYLDNTGDEWICVSDSEVMYDVVAWMELPEPYSGGKR